MITAIVLLLVLGLLFFLFARQEPHNPDSHSKKPADLGSSGRQAGTSSADDSSTSVDLGTVENAGEVQDGQSNVPVEFSAPKLQFQVLESKVNQYDSSWYYDIRATFLAEGQEVRGLKLQLRAYSEEGNVEFSTSRTALDSGERNYPGSELPFSYLHAGKGPLAPKLARVELQLQSFESFPVDGGYTEVPIDLAYAIELPRNTSVSALEKELIVKKGSSQSWAEVFVAFTNSGQRPISSARFTMSWTGKSGVIETSERWLVTSSDPIWLPGKTRTLRFLSNLPADARANDYELRLDQIE